MPGEKAALFFDIDGTIVSYKTKGIPESTVRAFEKARMNGHRIFINTGRTICTIEPEIKALPLDGYLCGCGTQILYQGQELMHSTIPEDKCRKYIREMFDCRIEGVCEGAQDMYFSRKPYKFSRVEMMRERMNSMGLGKSCHIEDIEHTSIVCDKLFLITYEDSDVKRCLDVLSDELVPISRRGGTYECIQKNYSKATAIEYVKDYLGVDIGQVYAFGDSSNDLSMFEYADHAVAMKEHDPVLDPHTEYVTDSVDEDGVYNAMKYYGVI